MFFVQFCRIYKLPLRLFFLLKKKKNYGVLLNSLRSNPADFNSHPAEWYKHNKEVYCFNTKANKWSAIGEGATLGTVHAGLVVSDNAIYNISGEVKPGTNTNVVTRLQF